MSRCAHGLHLLQAMRGRRQPVTAARLAEMLEVSERTIYRDVAELMAQGAPIDGEAGVGYILRPGLFLPPLMLSEDEVEAVMLGLRYATSVATTCCERLRPSPQRKSARYYRLRPRRK